MADNGGGLLGGGGFFGNLGPQGPYGAWPGCGCGSGCLMVVAGLILVFSGLLRSIGM
jgi:hypothetical protein